MAEHLTEEEQLAALKRWWADNGRSVIIGVVLAIGGYFAWQAWQATQREARESASILYEELVRTLSSDTGYGLSEDERLRVESVVEELKAEHRKLLYASDAALLAARIAVEAGDLDAAARHLRWVVETSPYGEIALLARYRLAQVLLAQEDYAGALAVLSDTDAGAYAAAYSELRGDVLVAQGQLSEAGAAYEAALNQLLPTQQSRRSIIQMKLDDARSRIPAAASLALADRTIS